MKKKLILPLIFLTALSSCSSLPVIDNSVALDMVKSSQTYLKDLNNIPSELIILFDYHDSSGSYEQKRHVALRTNDNISYQYYKTVINQTTDGEETQNWVYLTTENDKKYTILASYDKKAVTDPKTYYKYAIEDEKFIDKDYAKKLAQSEFSAKLNTMVELMEDTSKNVVSKSNRSNYLEVTVDYEVDGYKYVYYLKLEDQLIYQYNIEKYLAVNNEFIDKYSYEFHYDPLGIELPNLNEYRLIEVKK